MRFLSALVIVSVMVFMSSCSNGEASTKATSAEVDNGTESILVAEETPTNTNSATVEYLTTSMFIDRIFDYKSNPTKWIYKGDKPAIIDFYATWCGPCKRVAPIMEELATEYAGQINIYKVDTDKEKELAGQVFGIRSIPSILYIPVNGQPTMYTGAYPKQHYIDLINENLLKK